MGQKWKKIRKEGGSITGMTPAAPATRFAPQTPGLPAMKPVSGAVGGDVTPMLGAKTPAVTGDLLPGDATPIMTPGPAKAGEMTPNPAQPVGAQTPVLGGASSSSA